MKALILSGGTGSRLRPLTYTNAKQLIPVANKPILYYAIEAIKEAGIEEIGVIVGETKDEVISALGDGNEWGVSFTYIPQEAPLGLAHAVKIAEDFIGQDDFLMFLGDNLVRQGVKSFVEQFQREKPNSLILLSRVDEPQRFGVAELDGGRVIRLVEKPKNPPSDLALVGVYLFDNHIFQAVHSIQPSWRNELEITDAIQYLVDQNFRVDAHIIDGWWKDTGKPEDVLEANRMMLEQIDSRVDGYVCEHSQIIGRVVVEKGAKVIKSTLRGPLIIGSGSVVEDTYIGPFTAISENVEIKNSEIENSIVLKEVKISDIQCRIDFSLIGKGVKIQKQNNKPKAYNFVIGDNGQIDL
ncbi:glucose-1-phosphate thymidylyltransferase [Alicyclobacillus tolerans]|uniref:Glucose-1-phosphate thymidylyltransferase n=1 Tax=Alicyclobacillus tolerans TaxID=90970 RepID=A0ABT9LUY9_9BACL|nr:glucose-1-phosphate thymidylyltransferase [Alicyclobacillus tengchongensis]MDP9728096.1 glucose-1-phosphate thymidylyltransferase [Alicyclobacillus tengchongensis]